MRKWMRYFERLSPRIKVFTPHETPFIMFYLEAMKEMDIKWSLESQHQMPEWIIPERVAFVLGINSAFSHKLLDEPVWSIGKVFIFYFKDIAFNLRDFRSATALSNTGKSKSNFKWNYVQRYIIEILEMLDETNDAAFS